MTTIDPDTAAALKEANTEMQSKYLAAAKRVMLAAPETIECDTCAAPAYLERFTAMTVSAIYVCRADAAHRHTKRLLW